MKMGSGTTKKAERVERKKKKLTALLEITKLNDRDRAKEHPNLHIQEVQNSRKLNDEIEEGEIDDNCVISDGPRSKRHKTSNDFVSSYCNVPSNEVNNRDKYTTSTDKPFIIPTDELIKLRSELRERRNKLKCLPRLILNEMGEKALLTRDYRTPIFISDIQHLIMRSQLGNMSPVTPRWCSVEKLTKLTHTVVFVVEGATVYDYVSSESNYAFLGNIYHRVEVVSPMNYDGNLVEELATVPLSRTQKDKLEKKYGSLRQAELSSGLVFRILRSIFPIELPPCSNGYKSLPPTDKFPRTELLLSAWQMIEEGYPIPVKGELKDRYADYVMSKEKYAEVTPLSPMWGLDCEMCLTSIQRNELTRVSIVDENHKVVYESLVKPPNKIINYLTQFSGITKEMMVGVRKTLEDVQDDLRQLLPPDVILVGQSLNFDLHALKIMHPYVIDTSVIYNISGIRPRKAKLSILAERFLGEQIQTGHGHDSVEDSSSSLKLVQLKLANSVEFGDAVLSGCIESFAPTNFNNSHKSQNKRDGIFATSLFSHVTRNKKTAAVVGKYEIMSHYRPLAIMPSLNEKEKNEIRVKCQSVQTNNEAVLYACKEAQFHSFLMAHIKLERGESLADVDMWCSQMYQSLANNAFFIIIFAGCAYNKAHGACFLHIKTTNHNLNYHTSRYNSSI
ncbi:RNA exonuclease 5 isoform X2 [Lycorma delicatula]|uniref:RNA exonuclease 5 isoform X2 n=1 Tax=Lycorma delicatula TaxID=130591 RepID=UPI003F51A6DC